MISLPGGAIIGLILAIIIIVVGALLISNIVNFAKSQDEALAESYFEALAQAIDRACNTGEAKQTVWLPEEYMISISDDGGCFYYAALYVDTPCIINGTSYENKTICLSRDYEGVIACYYLPKHLSDCEKNYTIEKAELFPSSTFEIRGGPQKIMIRRKGNVLEFRY